MKSSAVIFDMDGVLVDSEPFYFASNNELFRTLGFQVDVRDYARFVGSSAENMWASLKERFGLLQEVDELINMEYRAHTAKLAAMRSLEPISGIVPLLNRLSDTHVLLGIASSSPRSVIELTLQKSGLDGYFPVRVSGEEVTHGKPHPDIFIKAAALLDMRPEHCLVIEDSPRGVAGAKTAGMKTIGFQNPNSGEQGLSGADMVIKSFSDHEIENILKLVDGMTDSA